MIEIRATTPDEYRVASDLVSTALLHAPISDDDWPKSLASWEGSDSISAWDGGRCVGHMAGYRFDTIVPGGATLPTNGVTRVGVLATHRRQGLARTLMTRLLGEAHERGQVLASLRASETRIYQRYGFGLAGQLNEVNVVAPLALIQLVLPRLRTGEGTLVNVTSDAAVEAYPGWGGYGSAKAAVEQASRVLAAEEPALRVWWVDPGDLRTRMHQEAFPHEDISDRPDPATVAPAFLRLLKGRPESGRIRLAQW